jgi:hypothetical protein
LPAMIQPHKTSLLSPADQTTVRQRADRDRCDRGLTGLSAPPRSIRRRQVMERGRRRHAVAEAMSASPPKADK